MEKYDYQEVVYNDVLEAIRYDYNLEDYDSRDEAFEALNEDFWVNDGVTGNASGSYTFNNWQAEENLVHNWDLLQEALQDFGCQGVDVLDRGAEWCDVTIRCYLLPCAIEDVLNDMETEGTTPKKWEEN